MPEIYKQVYDFVNRKLGIIWNMPESASKATLANLRHGIGHIPGELPQLWGDFLVDLPESLYGHSGKPSRAEWAIYTALTLYALHQQGRSVYTDKMSVTGPSLGMAVARLVKEEDDRERVWKRFNNIVSSSDMVEMSHYLRGMIQLLKANGVALDYPKLAEDIYFFQDEERRNRVKLSWGQDFYRRKISTDHKED